MQDTLSLIRTLNPLKQSSKIAQLKLSLGLSDKKTASNLSDSQADDLESLCSSISSEVRRMVDSYEAKLAAQSQMGDRINLSA